MKSYDLLAVGGTSPDAVNRLKKRFLLNVLRDQLTVNDIHDSIDPETGESPLSDL
jgi:hypothetical protein